MLLTVAEYKESIKKKKKNKYKSSKCVVDGIKFHSQKEATYYIGLKLMIKSGTVSYFLRQVPIYLPGNVKYIVDFQVFYSDGLVRYIDVKGVETPMFIMKRKQVEDLYPIEIETV